jgi:hypothetical protein
MKSIKPIFFIIIAFFIISACSKAPIIPQASNRVVLGEFFTQDR